MSASLPNVAVLLAAYNGRQWIEEQLHSIRSQAAVNIDIYISVDVSDDDTQAFCEAYALTYGNVFVLPGGERFGGAACNFFRLFRDVELQGYDFVSLADQDDIWRSDKIARAISCLQLMGAQGYSSNVTAFWADGRRHVLNKAQPQRHQDYFFEAAGPGCTYVFRHDLATFLQQKTLQDWAELGRVGLHDWYFYAMARHSGYTWYIDAWPSMDYRQHSTNQFGANVGFRALASRLSRVREGWWLRQVKLIATLAGRDGREPAWIGFDRADYLWLALHARMCRRRTRDQVFFFVLCCFKAVAPGR